MTIKTWMFTGVMLALLAFPASIAYGDPPPKQGTEPGVVAHLADCTEDNCLPPIKPRLVLAATNGQIHVVGVASTGDPDDGGQAPAAVNGAGDADPDPGPPDPPVIKG
jgi:hypothetical protein